jgi:endonuclease/exonuclease/phosphatase family metal-dependent hydrolase
MRYVLLALSILPFIFGKAVGQQATVDMQPRDEGSIRVMSFNIRYGTANDGDNHWNKRKDFLMDTIHAFGPDLLGTQETLRDQRDFIMSKLAGYESFGVGRDDGKDGGEMAALFYRASRFEKLAGGHFWLSETPDTVGSKGWDAALPRIATWVKLRDLQNTQVKPIFFLNTHFDHQGRQARKEAAMLIRKKVLELGAECDSIVTGDFNAGADSDVFSALFADHALQESPLVDTFTHAHPKHEEGQGTFSGFQSTATAGPRIDWVGCSRSFQVLAAAIDRTQRDGRTPSDHFPVTAILKL